MKLIKRRVKRPFMFGRIVHEMVELYANGDDPFERLYQLELENGNMFSSEREMYGDIINDIRAIMISYFEFYESKDDIKYIRRKGRNAEHKFELEIADGILMTGKIDAVVDSKNKLRWLAEHKTFSRLPSEDHRWRNLQSGVYIKVIQLMGWFSSRPIEGTLWDYIWSKAPAKPALLKNGTLSRKAIDTVPEMVVQTAKELGLKIRNQTLAMEMAQESQNKYYHRMFNPLKQKVVDTIFSDFIDTAREMSEYHDTRKDMNIERHCEWCDYEPLCRARLQGNDIDMIMEREYDIDADKPVEEELGEAE